MSRNHWGACIKFQEFEDGWLYEFSTPIDAAQAVFPRAKTAKIMFSGRWVDAFHEDGTNYLTVWMPRKEHEELFPEGPPSFRYYDEAAREVARAEYERWLDPNDTYPSGVERTGELKIVELGLLPEEDDS